VSVALVIFVATLAASLLACLPRRRSSSAACSGRTTSAPAAVRHDRHQRLRARRPAALIFNMMTFWFFAFPLEKRSGRSVFAVLYFLGSW